MLSFALLLGDNSKRMGTYWLPVIVTLTNIDSIAPYRLVHTDLYGHVCVLSRNFFVGADNLCIDYR